MPILGAHMSIAGGYDQAVRRATACGCHCLQLFTHNSNQWKIKEPLPPDIQRFRRVLAETPISHCLAHGSYLINLASPNTTLWQRSVEAMVGEIRLAKMLNILAVVVHPGSHMNASPEDGLRRIIQALDEVYALASPKETRCLLETTAGQGTSLGWRFEHLAAILEGVSHPDWLGVCLDSCHVFAAGYLLETSKQYQATMRQFDQIVGLAQLRAIHLNDSRRPGGSRIDRHDHIGRGQMGLAPFEHMVNDPRFQEIPMFLETPKGKEGDRDLDQINLDTLQSLIRKRTA